MFLDWRDEMTDITRGHPDIDVYEKRCKYGFKKLPIYHPELADTVMKIENGNHNSIKASAYAAGKKNGMKFKTRSIGTTIYVWRLS